MRVAVVHYHLRPGGVARVIESALAAAKDSARFAVLVGEPPPDDFAFKNAVRVVPGIGYEDASGPRISPGVLALSLIREASDALGAQPDVWHFHNHSLGKNCGLSEAARLLCRRSRVLLQIHDFAEDGRPALFRNLLQKIGDGDLSKLGRHLYPQCANVHYALLNSRDRSFLSTAGARESNLHVLSNPVVLPGASEKSRGKFAPRDKRRFIYCTRAIRRKNIGEFLLWSSLAGKDERFAITLAPENPLERPRYQEWKDFAGRLSLPVEFEAGRRSGQSLASLLEGSFASVTTSVAEGFGLAFLESWLVNCPVVGRRLSEITDDFEDCGVDLSHLYDRLLLPLDRGDRNQLFRRIRTRFEAFCSRCQKTVPPGAAEMAIAASSWNGRVDFARMDEQLQRKMIEKAAASKSFRSEIHPRHLVRAGAWSGVAARNRAAVTKAFGPEKYGSRLLDVYRLVAESDMERTSGCIDMNKLLDEFMAPERFFLLKS